MNRNLLFNNLGQFAALSQPLQDYLSGHLHSQLFHKGDQMPYLPPISQTAYFIEYGLVSGVKFIEEMKCTLWILDQLHFIIPAPGQESPQLIDRMEFLSTTLLAGIDLTHIYEAIRLFPEAHPVFSGILMRSMAEARDRELLMRLPSESRFITALRQHPQFFTESCNVHLASYLNLSIRQFTRIKRNVYRAKRPFGQ